MILSPSRPSMHPPKSQSQLPHCLTSNSGPSMTGSRQRRSLVYNSKVFCRSTPTPDVGGMLLRGRNAVLIRFRRVSPPITDHSEHSKGPEAHRDGQDSRISCFLLSPPPPPTSTLIIPRNRPRLYRYAAVALTALCRVLRSCQSAPAHQ